MTPTRKWWNVRLPAVDFLVALGSTAETPCLTDDEKVRLFRHRPTMLEWYEKVAAVTDRVTDFLQSAQSANNYPAGTTDRPDKEDDA